ncbi:hypothetical protein [Anabaena lutea]|uniref:Uncharacterized protein n=1 Tax=Anabaena lutea FACHB-196 TaxID=2692881 RepID=A0ABR8FAY5_9NOST|nr:hypothetical protein [Anabaena lutea]MBD2566738.1 hypothetical protein [Anabaena lutea FACHB-196]
MCKISDRSFADGIDVGDRTFDDEVNVGDRSLGNYLKSAITLVMMRLK